MKVVTIYNNNINSPARHMPYVINSVLTMQFPRDKLTIKKSIRHGEGGCNGA